MCVVGRYAPSPTGDLHLGNLRTALVAWLAARAAGGRIYLRIEDLDPPRVIPGAEARMRELLNWLGFDWDPLPQELGPSRQSERQDLYRQALKQLALANRLYACTCTRSELQRLASAPHAAEAAPAYPGICQNKGLPLDLTDPKRAQALRFRVEPGLWHFNDCILGTYEQDVLNAVGDFVIRRADGLFAYQLAVVVDDALMGINQVVRGADLLDSTPRQMQLLGALGAPFPAYAHVPLVLDSHGQRLAKRDQATSIAQLRTAGAQPERLLGLLGHSLGLLDGRQPTTLDALRTRFDWNALSKQPWSFNVNEHMAWLQGGLVDPQQPSAQ